MIYVKMVKQVKKPFKSLFVLLLLFPGLNFASARTTAEEFKPGVPEAKVMRAMHSISSHPIMDWVVELCSEKYEGRLSGTPAYDAAAEWLAGKLQRWGLMPGGNDKTFYQHFANPYTLVLPGSHLALELPVGRGGLVRKHYRYQDEYFPGATSDSGELSAEVIYVGYGISAPELGFDEYRGLDVRGKIVLVETEVPVSPAGDPEKFAAWRPYSFHQYKMKNARDRGAAGMLYNYHIANPNGLFQEGFQISYVGSEVVADIFAGSGRDHGQTKRSIIERLKPASFRTGKKVSMKNLTRHLADGRSSNVIGIIPASAKDKTAETLLIGAHLDHLGLSHELMPGANDNASGVAVVMAAAEALAGLDIPLRRSLAFVFFGAEEQGVKGSEYFLSDTPPGIGTITAFFNLDGVGRGNGLNALAALNYPHLWANLEKNNRRYIRRELRPLSFHNLARPRLDAAHFMWAGIPTLSFSAFASGNLPYPTYHTTHDRPEILTPEIMEDLARLLFLTLLDMALE